MTVLFAPGPRRWPGTSGGRSTCSTNTRTNAELAADPALVANAIEEILAEPLSPVNARHVTQDVTFHEVTIPAESRVILLTGSADERIPDVDVFDIHRTSTCIYPWLRIHLPGALARMEGRIGGGDAQALAGVDRRPRPGRAALHEHGARIPQPPVRRLRMKAVALRQPHHAALRRGRSDRELAGFRRQARPRAAAIAGGIGLVPGSMDDGARYTACAT